MSCFWKSPQVALKVHKSDNDLTKQKNIKKHPQTTRLTTEVVEYESKLELSAINLHHTTI